MKLSDSQLKIIEPLSYRWCCFQGELIEGMSEGDVKAKAVPRIARLFAGEVHYSEASPGDRAIWHYMPRNMDAWLSGDPIREEQWRYAFPEVVSGLYGGPTIFGGRWSSVNAHGTVQFKLAPGIGVPPFRTPLHGRNSYCAVANCGACVTADLDCF